MELSSYVFDHWIPPQNLISIMGINIFRRVSVRVLSHGTFISYLAIPYMTLHNVQFSEKRHV